MRLHTPVLALLASLLVTGCGAEKKASDVADSVKRSVDPVAQAATKSSDAKSVTLGVKGSVRASGQTIPIEGTGGFDLQAKRGTFDFTTSVPGQGALKLHEVLDGQVVYISSDAFKSRLPAGKRWLKLDLAAIGRKQGVDLDSLQQLGAGNDPTQFLRYLEKAGAKPRKVGAETIDGTPTTKYAVTIDLAQVAAKNGDAAVKRSVESLRKMTGTTRIPAEVWIDDQSRIRREHISYTATRPVQIATDLTLDFTDYGRPVRVKVPADSASVDLAKQIGG